MTTKGKNICHDSSIRLSSDDSSDDERTIMGIGDLDEEEEDNKYEVSILLPKDKLHLFFKIKLTSMTSSLIDGFHDFTIDKDQLLGAITSVKYEYIDIKNIKMPTKKEKLHPNRTC